MAGTVRAAVEQLEQNGFDVIYCDATTWAAAPTASSSSVRAQPPADQPRHPVRDDHRRKSYVSVVTVAECLPTTTCSNPSPPTCCSSASSACSTKQDDWPASMRCRTRTGPVVAACDEIIASGGRYQADALRIRGNALIACGRLDRRRPSEKTRC